MNRNIPNKIHIIGSVGSGKTTLARNLSRKISVPYYELDNVVWKRHKSEDIRRSDAERDECLDRIIRSDRWIIEGAHTEKANYTPSFHIFMKMFKWNTGFEKQSKPMILNMLRQDNIKSLIVKDNRRINL
nr:hypothetical protein [Paenibacillus ferrarius]